MVDNIYKLMSLIAPSNMVLHSPCTEVTDIDAEVRELVSCLIRVMRKEGGIGITANQIGSNKAVMILNIPGDYIHVCINPVIRSVSGRDLKTKEGCLSYPGKLLTAPNRKRHVSLHALNLKGEQFILDTTDDIYTPKVSALLSVCIQHEIDHINGRDMRAYLRNI